MGEQANQRAAMAKRPVDVLACERAEPRTANQRAAMARGLRPDAVAQLKNKGFSAPRGGACEFSYENSRGAP